MTADNTARVAVRSLDDFAELRTNRPESSSQWWPDIGPIGNRESISFTHRRCRLGPIIMLDIDFQEEVWVNGGDVRPHYHVTVPVATFPPSSKDSLSLRPGPGSVAVFRPEGKAHLSS